MEKFETKLNLVFRKDGSFDTRIGMNLQNEEMLTFNFLYDGLWFRNTVCDCRILVKLKWEIFVRRVMLYRGEIECWVVRKQCLCEMSIVETRI